MNKYSAVKRWVFNISALILLAACATPPATQSPSTPTPPSPQSSQSQSSQSQSSQSQSSQSQSSQSQSSQSQSQSQSAQQQSAQTRQQSSSAQSSQADATSTQGTQNQTGARQQTNTSNGQQQADGAKTEDEILTEALGTFDKSMQSSQQEQDTQAGSTGTTPPGGAESQQGQMTARTPGASTDSMSAKGGQGQGDQGSEQRLVIGPGGTYSYESAVPGGPADSSGKESGSNQAGSSGGPVAQAGVAPGRQQGGGGSPPIGSGRPLTDAERIGQLDGKLDQQLAEFDGLMLSKREDVKQEENEEGSQSGYYGAGSAAGGQGYGADGEGSDPLMTAMNKGPDTRASTVGQLPNAPSDNRKGEFEYEAPPSSIPSDIPDGSDDDVVARQLREAAMREKDPVLREKLWDEYRKYKKGVHAQR